MDRIEELNLNMQDPPRHTCSPSLPGPSEMVFFSSSQAPYLSASSHPTHILLTYPGLPGDTGLGVRNLASRPGSDTNLLFEQNA